MARDGAGQGSAALQGWLHCQEKGPTPADALPWGAIPLPARRGWLLSAGARPVQRLGASEVHLPGATKERSVSGLKGGRSPASEVSADICPVQSDRGGVGEGEGEKVPLTQGPKPLPSLLLGPQQWQPQPRCRGSSLAFSFEHQQPGSLLQGRASSPGPAQGRASHRRTAMQLLSLCAPFPAEVGAPSRRAAEGHSSGRSVLLRFSLFSPFWGSGRSCRRHGGIAARGSGRFPFLQCGAASGRNQSDSQRAGQASLPQAKGHEGTISLSVQPANLSAWARCLRGAGG